jgi:hypothetical protein
MREHNTIESSHREPYLYHGDTYNRLVKALYDRYSMIAYWYTWTMYGRWNGRGAVVPLWFEWPEIESFHHAEHAALFGDSLLVSPVIGEAQTVVEVEKPPGVWYDFWTGRELTKSANVSVSMNDIPVYIRGGKIVPWYAKPIRTTIETIVTPMTLVIAVGEDGTAEGSVYLDDGTTFNATLNNIFVHRIVRYRDAELVWNKARFPVEERGVPEILKNAIVESLVILDRKGVSRVTGLSLPVCGVWAWRKGNSGVWTDDVRNGKSLVFIGVAGIVACSVLVVIALRMRKKSDEIDESPLIE